MAREPREPPSPRNGYPERKPPKPPKPPAKPPAKPPVPPVPPKDAFVPVRIVFDPAYAPWHGKPALLVDIVRNLPLDVTIDEFYVTFLMRAADNLPGYYGDVSFRRRNDPDAPALNQAKFTCVARVVGMTLPENPSGPAAPSRKEKVWVDTRWKKSDNNPGGPDYFFVPLS